MAFAGVEIKVNFRKQQYQLCLKKKKGRQTKHAS